MPKDFKAQIERNFTYHPPQDEQVGDIKVVWDGCKFLADIINERCPDGREKSLALTNLEQVAMWAQVAIWANAAIARPGD